MYLPALRLGFALDDLPLVRDDPRVASPGSIPKIFAQPYWNLAEERAGLYRPVTTSSFVINRALTGTAPWGFHAVNVLLHAGACVLLWRVVRGTATRYGTALWAALLFAALPVHVEAVANVVGRAEILAAVFVLAAWLAHRRGRLPLAALLWLAAVLSKESAILAPALYLLDDRLSDRPVRPSLVPYGAALAVALAARALALGGLVGAENAVFLDNPAAFAGVGPRVATGLWTLAKQVGLLLWPCTLVSDYSYDALPVVSSWSDPRLWVGVALVAAWGVGLVVAIRRRSRPWAIALAAWGLLSLPASNLLIATGTIFSERAAYLPSLGACLIAGHLVAGAGRGRVAPAAALAALLTLACGARAFVRIPAWGDNATLATTDVASSPRSAKLQAGAAIAAADRGDVAEAEAGSRRALAIWPDYHQVRYNLAVLLARRGDSGGAAAELDRIVAAKVRNPRPYALLAELRRNGGDPAAARAACDAAAALGLDAPDLRRTCARVYRESR